MNIKKFHKLYGKSVDEPENPAVITVSASETLSVVKTKEVDFLKKEDLGEISSFEEYTMLGEPKESNDRVVVIINEIMFGFDFIKQLIDKLIGKTFKFATYKIDKFNGCGIFRIDEDHSVLIAPVVPRKETPDIEGDDDIHEWNEFFSTIADDMVL